MQEKDTPPSLNDIPCLYASRFFSGPGGGISYQMANHMLMLSPSPAKLMPSSESKNGLVSIELSVVLHSEQENPRWEEGKVPCGGKLPFGSIELSWPDIRNAGLDVALSGTTWSAYHANIVGWDEDEDIQQTEAIVLARSARLVVNECSVQRLLRYCASEYLDRITPELLTYCSIANAVSRKLVVGSEAKSIEEYDIARYEDGFGRVSK